MMNSIAIMSVIKFIRRKQLLIGFCRCCKSFNFIFPYQYLSPDYSRCSYTKEIGMLALL